MAKIPVAVRLEMITIIQEQIPQGLTLFGDAMTPLMIAIQKEADDNASAKEDLFGLMIDCAFCLLPVGKILGKLVGNLSRLSGTRISKLAMDQIISKTKERVSTEIAKTVTVHITKEVANSALEALSADVQGDFDLLAQMQTIFKSHTDALSDLIRNKEADYGKLPDSLLARIFARWEPSNNMPALYKTLVTETFAEIKRITSSLGHKVPFGSTATETDGKIVFQVLDYSDAWRNPSSNPQGELWVQGIPTLMVTESRVEVVTDSGGRRKLEKIKNTTVSRIPGPLRFFAMTLAWEKQNVLNDPFVFEPQGWQISLLTSMNQLQNYADDSTLYLTIRPQGKYSTKTIFGFDYPGARRFDIEPSLIAEIEN